MEAVTTPDRASPAITGAMATALEAGRARYNARIAVARRLVPGFDAERFGRHFGETAQPAVDAVAAVAPDRVQTVTDALFEIAIDLAGRGSLGPIAGPPNDLAWMQVLPAAAPLVAVAPDLMVRALTNAVCNIALVSGARPADWVARMAAAGPSCTTPEEWLACGLVAAWTSGVAHFRNRALATLATMPPSAARTVLSLTASDSPVDVRELAARLAADPWLPPDRAGDVPAVRSLDIVRTVGGFRGLGGYFIAPPDVALSEGRFVVFDGQGAWTLFADACGATLVRVDEPKLDVGSEQGSDQVFTVKPNGRVIADGDDRTFPVLADAASTAATSTTLVVAVPRSHEVFVVALVPRWAS